MRYLLCAILSLLLTNAVLAEDRVRPIQRIPPAYPQDALEKEISGRVKAVLTVDEDGKVTEVRLTSESPQGFGFGEAARDAFLQWVYPHDVPGDYPATFTFALIPLSLTAEEAALDFAGPPIDRAAIRFPSKALDAGVSGNVELVAIVDASGSVESVRILKETPPAFGFGESATNALRRYRFAAGPRSVWTMTVKFRMEIDPSEPAEIALPAKDLPAAPEPRRAGTPDYPYEARKARIEGIVELGIQIDKRGVITHAGVIREEPVGHQFAANAMKALGEWRFRGSDRGTYKLTVEFKLED